MFYRNTILYEQDYIEHEHKTKEDLLKTVAKFWEKRLEYIKIHRSETTVSFTCKPGMEETYKDWFERFKDTVCPCNKTAVKGKYEYPMIWKMPCYYNIVTLPTGEIKFGFTVFDWKPDKILENEEEGA